MWLSAILLLGAILRYIPLGIAVARPVGILAMHPGLIVTEVMVETSYPIDPSVALVGITAVGISFLILTAI